MSFSSERMPTNSASSEQVPPISMEVVMELQTELALTVYGHEHPEEVIDAEHPENNSRDVRNAAMQNWVQKGLAGTFRDYINKHPGLDFHMHDSVTLEKLLEELESEGETVH